MGVLRHMLRLTTLGAIDLRDGRGHPVREILAQPKRVGLLVYLAVAGSAGPVSRDRLLALFWPEADDTHARNALSQALHHLRQALGPEVLSSQGATTVELCRDRLWCDATAFAEALERGDVELALDIYRGEFCPTLLVSGAPDLGQWLDAQRRRLGTLAVAGARSFAERLEARGDPHGALKAAKRALALRPDEETDVRALIGMLERSGDAAAALAAYQEHAQRLASELELEPASETRQLALDIRHRRERQAAALPTPTDSPWAAQPDSAPARAPAARVGPGHLLLVLLALLLGFATWRGVGAVRLPVVDPQLVVVAPWRVASTDTSLAYLVEGFSDLVAGKLDVPGRLRTTDMRTVLAAWRRAGRDPGQIGEREAASEALQLGAGRLVTGSLVGSQRNIMITASLAATDGGRRDVVTATGPVDSLAALADTIARGLLVATFDDTTLRADELRRVPLAALRPYLPGRSAFRAGRYESAFALFRAAVAADSAFALASLGALEAADFATRDATPTRAIAWRLRDKLGAADRSLLAALAPPAESSTSAGRLDALERYARLAPERAEAWYWLGDALFHEGAYLGRDSGLARAEAAFSRSVALDSTFLAPLAHLLQIAAARDDARAVKRLAGLYFVRDTASEVAQFLRWRSAVALGDSATARRIEADTARLATDALRLISEWAAIEGISGPTAVRMARAFLGRARSAGADSLYAERLLTSAVAASGQFAGNEASVLALRHRYGEPDDAGWHVAIALWLDGPAAVVESLMASEPHARDPRRRGDDAAYRLQWALQTGRSDTLVTRLLAAYDATRAWRTGEDWPHAIIVAAARRREALPRLLAHVDSLRQAAPQSGGGYAQIEVMALLLAGEPTRAATIAARRPFRTGGDQSIAPLFRLEGLAKERSGDTRGAIRAYRRYLNLRSQPDAGARPYADTVRAALARLEHRSPA